MKPFLWTFMKPCLMNLFLSGASYLILLSGLQCLTIFVESWWNRVPSFTLRLISSDYGIWTENNYIFHPRKRAVAPTPSMALTGSTLIVRQELSIRKLFAGVALCIGAVSNDSSADDFSLLLSSGPMVFYLPRNAAIWEPILQEEEKNMILLFRCSRCHYECIRLGQRDVPVQTACTAKSKEICLSSKTRSTHASDDADIAMIDSEIPVNSLSEWKMRNSEREETQRYPFLLICCVMEEPAYFRRGSPSLRELRYHPDFSKRSFGWYSRTWEIRNLFLSSFFPESLADKEPTTQGPTTYRTGRFPLTT